MGDVPEADKLAISMWCTMVGAIVLSRVFKGDERSDVILRMARKTEWVAVPPQSHAGLGQRMLATDDADYALMDIRRIDLDVTVTDSDSAAGVISS